MESVKQSMAEMAEVFNTRMAEFQGRIDKASSSTTTHHPTLSSVAAEFDAFRAFIMKAMDSLQRQVEVLGQQVDSMEMRSRRKILLFHGVPESGGEDTTAQVVNLLKAHLKSSLTADDISRSHRMGRPRSNQIRCILVKFRDTSNRNAIWFGKTALKGSGVIVSEFLTRPRHDIFMAARERFGVRNCYTKDGSVYVLVKGGERRNVTSRADLERIQDAPPSVPVDGAVGEAGQSASQPAKKVRRQAAVKSRT
jgi:hypothetical protein